jgi:hypothetical protein
VTELTDDQLAYLRRELVDRLAYVDREIRRRKLASATVEQLHGMQAHPDFEYAERCGSSGNLELSAPPWRGQGWEHNVHIPGLAGRWWDRDGDRETTFWMRRLRDE